MPAHQLFRYKPIIVCRVSDGIGEIAVAMPKYRRTGHFPGCGAQRMKNQGLTWYYSQALERRAAERCVTLTAIIAARTASRLARWRPGRRTGRATVGSNRLLPGKGDILATLQVSGCCSGL